MQRNATDELRMWNAAAVKAPLFVGGAGRVGKTYVLRAFAQSSDQQCVYADINERRVLRELLRSGAEPETVTAELERIAGGGVAPDALVIIDNFQEIPGADAALRTVERLNAQARGLGIICAGAPGVFNKRKKADRQFARIDLRPLSFSEFLCAVGRPQLAEPLRRGDIAAAVARHAEYDAPLNAYLFVGGMPEAVAAYAKNADLNAAREVQRRILSDYEIACYRSAPRHIAPRARMIWNSVPSQLGRRNRKFQYGLVEARSRVKDYGSSLDWLEDNGFTHRVYRSEEPAAPLDTHQDVKAFKLFILDVGLLGCIAGVAPQDIADNAMRVMEGALAEQFAFQQMLTQKDTRIGYWANGRGTADVDFIVENGTRIVPVNVETEQNPLSKHMRAYCERYAPKLSARLTMGGANVPPPPYKVTTRDKADFRSAARQGWTRERQQIECPLYCAEAVAAVIAAENG